MDKANTTPARGRTLTDILAASLLALAVVLAAGTAYRGTAAAETVAVARAGVSGASDDGRVAMAPFLAANGAGLPSGSDLVLQDMRTTRSGTVVTFSDPIGGGTFAVTVEGRSVTAVEFTGQRRAAPSDARAGGTVVATPLWRVAAWDSEGEFPSAEATLSVEVTPGIAAAVPPEGESVVTTGGVSVVSGGGLQYSALPMPGEIESVADAMAVPEEWIGVTDDLAERTGFEPDGSGIVPILYGDLPALASYAAYHDGDRTRIHYLLLVFLPEQEAMVLVASQEESSASVPVAQRAEGEGGEGFALSSSGATASAGPSSPLATADRPAISGLAAIRGFLGRCGLMVARETATAGVRGPTGGSILP